MKTLEALSFVQWLDLALQFMYAHKKAGIREFKLYWGRVVTKSKLVLSES